MFIYAVHMLFVTSIIIIIFYKRYVAGFVLMFNDNNIQLEHFKNEVNKFIIKYNIILHGNRREQHHYYNICRKPTITDHTIKSHHIKPSIFCFDL